MKIKDLLKTEDFKTVNDIQLEIAIEELGINVVSRQLNESNESSVLDNFFMAWPGLKLTQNDIGKKFVPIGVQYITEAKWINISTFDHPAMLYEIDNYYRFKDDNGVKQTFPYKNNISNTILRDENEFNKYQIDLRLRLSDWRITYKNLSETQ